MGPTTDTTLHSRFSRVLAALVAAIALATEVGLAVNHDWEALLRATAPLALLVLGMYMLFWAPYVTIGPALLVIGNPARTWTITWPAIDDIQTRWNLTIVTARARVTAWVAPRQNRYASIADLRRDSYGRPDFEAERAHVSRDLPSSVAGLAAILVTRQWQDYREAGLLGAVEGEGVTVRWHVPLLVALAALVVLSIAGLVL